MLVSFIYGAKELHGGPSLFPYNCQRAKNLEIINTIINYYKDY